MVKLQTISKSVGGKVGEGGQCRLVKEK